MTAGLGFMNLLAVAAIAVVAPILASVLPVRVPSVVLEVVAGIVVGPSVLGWVRPDEAVTVLALIGLAFLLFLSGLEIDLQSMRGEVLRRALAGFGATMAIGLALGFGARAIGWVASPLFLAVALGSTSLGIVAPVLKDSGHVAGPVGRVALAGGTIATFATILLLSLAFAQRGGGTVSRLSALVMFVAAAAAVAYVVARAGRSMGLDRLLVRLQDTTAAIRVRIAVLIMLAFVALAARTGLETILGAFVAGAVLAATDREMASHPRLRLKLESIGFGFVVPIFFVTSGLRLDFGALVHQPAALLRVPAFLIALVATRGLPALTLRRTIGRNSAVATGLLQATSLPFIVTATQLGVALGTVRPETAAGLVAAGLLSALLFPPVAIALLSRSTSPFVAAGPPRPEVAST